MLRIRATAILFFSAASLLLGHANAQTRGTVRLEPITCSPAPCVLPPTQASEGGFFVNSPAIVADPLNPEHLLLGANDDNCPQGTGLLAAYTSNDGGSSWSSPFCMPDITEGVVMYLPANDATVAFDRNGTGYVAGSYYHKYAVATGFVAFAKSSDGVNWSPPAAALEVPNSLTGYSWLAADTSAASPYVNRLYVSAVVIGPPGQQYEDTVVVAHSSDGGVTWHQARVAPTQISPKMDFYTNIAIGKDGTVYLTWMYCNTGPNACGDDRAAMVFSKSSDGGNTWSSPTLMTVVVLNQEGIPNTSVGADNYPAIGVDNSNGPHSGNLYVSMYTWTGTYLRVQIVRSTDGGTTWSQPVPVATASDTHDQFFPWLSVSPRGLVGVSWLDRRNDPANVDYQAFAAISRDGGQTFQPNVQLTTAFSNPDVNGYPPGWMGDYTGNTWAGPNYFIAAWMDSSNGVDMQDVVGGIRLH